MSDHHEYRLEDFSFDLPEALIAQYPKEKRASSRLMVLNRKSAGIVHKNFDDITDFFDEGDLLVLNNTKVIPAGIDLRRKSGGKVRAVLAQRLSGIEWLIVCDRTRRLKTGEKLFAEKDRAVYLEVMERRDDFIRVRSSVVLDEETLSVIGEIPLPPYIKRGAVESDRMRYQTVYAEKKGAAAAPTAGLHFTEQLFFSLEERGVEITFVTLHVSWGTFQPVRHSSLAAHKMHSEYFTLDRETADRINDTRSRGNRVVAVGTTSLRVLESTFKDGINNFQDGMTDIFIYPPYEIKSADALITNFHTPGSTLLMLVSAFAGYEAIMDAYKTAVKNSYRFFSYGDAMLII